MCIFPLAMPQQCVLYGGMKIEPNILAKAGGVTPAFIRMVMAGKRRPSLTVALRIYDATGVQLGQLAGLTRSQIDVARGMV
jgi:transcriptional regulator with XRE-family HTH domain